MSRYRFIEAEKVEERSVNRACAVLEVSRAAYYEWHKQEPSARAQQDRELAEKVKAIFCRSRQTYGHPGCIENWVGRACAVRASGWPG